MPAVNLHKQAMTTYKDEEPRPNQSQDVKKTGLPSFKKTVTFSEILLMC